MGLGDRFVRWLCWTCCAGANGIAHVNDTVSPWLLLASIIFTVLAGLRHWQEQTVQTVNLFPDEGQSIYHGPIRQADGTLTTQIGIRCDVFNLTDKSIWLADVRLLRPRCHAPVLNNSILLRDQSSPLYGRHELPPHAKTPGHVDLLIQEDLTDQIAK